MLKRMQKMYLALFIILICLPRFLCLIFEKYIDSANYENRIPAEKPAFHIDTFKDYPSEYEAYFNDNLPFRNVLISLNSWVNYCVFKSSSSERVILGKNKWLFYGDTNDGNSIADYEGTNAFSDEEIQAMKDVCRSTQNRLEEMGIQLAIVIPPNKERVYSEYMPDCYTFKESSRTDLMIEELKNEDIHVIDLKNDLLNRKSDYPLYYPYDTHWNQLGAYVGACSILNSWGYPTEDLSELTILSAAKRGGDLANMLNLSNLVFDDGAEYSIQESYSGDGTQLSDGFLYFKNPDAPIAKTVFLLGDSFREAMKPALCKYFSDVYIVPRGSYTYTMLEQAGPDYMIVEYVERCSDALIGMESIVFEK